MYWRTDGFRDGPARRCAQNPAIVRWLRIKQHARGRRRRRAPFARQATAGEWTSHAKERVTCALASPVRTNGLAGGAGSRPRGSLRGRARPRPRLRSQPMKERQLRRATYRGCRA